MAISNPDLWQITLGANADVNELPQTTEAGTGDASFNFLFPTLTEIAISAGGVPPSRLDFNALFKLLGDNIYFMQRGGHYQWDENVSYEEGAIVLYEGIWYRSLHDANTGRTPPDDQADWEEFYAGSAGLKIVETKPTGDVLPNVIYAYPSEI